VKTSDIMTLGVATVRQDASLLKAVQTMVNHRLSALPVVDDKGLLCGILTEGDIVRAVDLIPTVSPDLPEMARKKALNANVVEKFMTVGVVSVGPDAGVEEAVALMKERALKRLPIVAGGKVLGMLSRADILRALVA
jgi:CBS domain-containing protein